MRCTEWWELSNGLNGAGLKKGIKEQTALTKLAAYEDEIDEPEELKQALTDLAAYRRTGITPEQVSALLNDRPVNISFDVGSDGFLLAINMAFKERFGITTDQVKEKLEQLSAYRAIGKMEELERVVRCKDCVKRVDYEHDTGECESEDDNGFCSEGVRKQS